MSIVDDDGVGIGYVYTILDDGRSQQHVELAIYEVHNQAFELLGWHTSVAHAHTCLGTETCDESLQRSEILHVVMHEVNLTSARQLLLDGIAYDLLAE